MYDIIGDIHGHADALELLLRKLGYENEKGYYSHPERKVIFVGDFIDRGPKIRETLSIVKRMVDENSAKAIMGNHEYNALCYYTELPDGKFLRPRNNKNDNQMKETIEQFKDFEEERKYYFGWFRTLPLHLDLGNLRIVHACWDDDNINHIRNNKIEFTDEFLIELFNDKKSNLYKSIDETLKGKEYKIPGRNSFMDKDGFERSISRIRWWLDPAESKYEEYYFEEIEELEGMTVDLNIIKSEKFYSKNEVPVIFGHYWFQGNPEIVRKNAVCVDYSVAKGGKLVAYIWNGEQELVNENFVWV
ncbi:MAG: metallophosphoesterase [Ignavibacteria bacterium]|nr:metallophosphoesterase [Ignavibacteria bacterium]